MKRSVYMLLFIPLLVVACEYSNTPLPIENNSQPMTITEEIQSQYNIPLHFKDAKGFRSYLMSDDYAYIDKENEIFRFFDNISHYPRAELISSFASIGSNIEWDVDLISQFKHNMVEIIIDDPELLIVITDQLSEKELNKFANFYFGHVIWNDIFPEELYYLQSKDPSAFKTFIDVFYNRYQLTSKRKLNINYSKINESIPVPIKSETNNNSATVGMLDGEEQIIGLWNEGDWVFVYTGTKVGYVLRDKLKE